MVGQLFTRNSDPKQSAGQEQGSPQHVSYNPVYRVYQYYQFRRRQRSTSSCVFALYPICAILMVILLLPLLRQIDLTAFHRINIRDVPCGDSCKIELVETIPEGVVFNESLNHADTFDVWKSLIDSANSSIEIASFYWTLRENETYPHPSSKKGEEIFRALIAANKERGVAIKVAQNEPTTFQPNPDTEYLRDAGVAEVRSLNVSLLVGAGVLHTKFWIVDRRSIYLGSANMDWRSLTQVKELGVAVYDCPCVAADLGKIFDVYWDLAESHQIPNKWPIKYATMYNMANPLGVSFAHKPNLLYISSSPPEFSPKGRTDDILALRNTIARAKKFVHIAVMNYYPLTLYTDEQRFWPVIDDEIRRAIIERNVDVRILVSQWKSTRPMIYNFMHSLKSLNKFNKKVTVDAKKFIVPFSEPGQDKIPYARVNHNKYMVTDQGAFIGTSNWSGDYFTSTAGVSVVMPTNSTDPEGIRRQLVEIFDRDWNSDYAKPIY